MRKLIKKILNVGIHNESTRVEWLEKKLKSIPQGLRILDAGAGELQFKKFCSHLKYVSQDFGKYDGKGDGIGLQMNTWDNSRLDIMCDISAIPEPNCSFDAIMCIEVFEHLPNPVDALNEFARLLKPGGHLIITAPFCSMTHFAPYHFFSGFNRYFYEKHLTRLGFEIKDIQTNGDFFDATAEKIYLLPHVVRTYTNKKFTMIDRFFSGLILFSLSRFSKQKNKSSELLNFGFHVHAIKK